MEELIFFAMLIVFSIIESIARRRKIQKKKEQGEVEPEQFEWAQTPPWEAEELPTYDQDPSYDDRVESEPTTRAEAPAPEPTAADIWEEIAGLASGAKKREGPDRSGRASTVRLPKESPPLPTPEPSIPYEPTPSRVEAIRARRPSRLTSRTLPGEHFVHLAHAEYGTDPSERSPSEQDGIDPLAERRNRTSAGIHRRLRSKSAAELRQAIVLQEILGPPVTLRDESS